MSLNSPSDDRIDRAIEQMLTPAEWEAFKADAIKDPELRAKYVDQLWLHSTLQAERDSLGKMIGATEAPLPLLKKSTAAIWTSAAAAACITLALSLLLLPGRNKTQAMTRAEKPLATLIQAENCKWGPSELPTVQNAKLQAGTLSLLEGMATLRFENGTTLFLEAPTTIKLVDAMRCQVQEGSLVADVPPTARGFTVYTPELKAVDKGSRFGVTVGSLRTTHVYVFDGAVVVNKLNDTKEHLLDKGKAFIVGMDNVAQAAVTPEPVRMEHIYDPERWLSIPTSFRRGKDAYVQRGKREATGLHSLLMVKHTEFEIAKSNERRIYLTFDISQLSYVDIAEEFHISPVNISEAQLLLQPEPSGFGFASLVPDCTFAIYGITDQSLDYWKEGGISWLNAPAANDAGLLPNKVKKLAEFTLPRGSSTEVITIESKELADFIRQDTNGLVSFILVRETAETEHQGMAHAFASKEHPHAKPPTLRIR
ncbi:MAG TPA: FecR domain-containing protein [Verrucomicrobiae bacterium]